MSIIINSLFLLILSVVMIQRVHGRLKFIDERMRVEKKRKLPFFFAPFSVLYHTFTLSAVNKVILIFSFGLFFLFTYFIFIGITVPGFFGKNYLEQDLFTATISGLVKPYFVIIWPAIFLSMFFGVYSGIESAYIVTKKSEVFTSFVCKKINEVIDSLPRFLVIFLMIFFISAEDEYYQLYLLLLVGVLFSPVVYFNFKKRVEWLVKQRFIDAEFIAGQKKWRIKLVQIFWRNCRILTLSQFFYLYSNIVLTDACLGYLGVRQLRFPSLGGLMAAEMSFFDVKFLPVFLPALCLSFLIIILNLTGGYFEERYRYEMEEGIRYYSL